MQPNIKNSMYAKTLKWVKIYHLCKKLENAKRWGSNPKEDLKWTLTKLTLMMFDDEVMFDDEDSTLKLYFIYVSTNVSSSFK